MIKRLIMTILLSILIIISFILMSYSRLLSETEVLNKLDEMNYYDYAYKEINSKLELELPNKDLSYVYKDYVTKERIKEDVRSILDNYYNKENDSIKSNFYNNVIKKFKNNGDNNIKSLVNSLSDTYYNNLFRIDKLNKVIKFLPLKDSSKGLSFVLLAVTIFLIISFIKDISIYNSFVVSGLIFLMPKIFIHFKNIIKNFYYYNNTLSYFIKMYGYNIINTYFKYGLILLAIGLIGIFIHALRKDNWLKMSNDI